MRACVCVCVRAWLRACVCTCVRACVRACALPCVHTSAHVVRSAHTHMQINLERVVG